MPAGDVWGNAWLDAWGTSWKQAVTPTPAPTTRGGGIGKHRRYKYPRRIMVHGRVHTVRNADEERQILRAMLERAQLALEYADAVNDKPAVEQAKKRIVRIRKGLSAAEEARRMWLRRLLDEDEEILLAVYH